MTDPATSPPPDEPLGAIVHRLTEQVPELVRSEMRLARAELTEKGKAAGLGVGLFSVAGIIGLFALGAVVAAGILALDLGAAGLGRRARGCGDAARRGGHRGAGR